MKQLKISTKQKGILILSAGIIFMIASIFMIKNRGASLSVIFAAISSVFVIIYGIIEIRKQD